MLKVIRKDDGYWLSIDGDTKALVNLGNNHGEIVTAALEEAVQHNERIKACHIFLSVHRQMIVIQNWLENFVQHK